MDTLSNTSDTSYQLPLSEAEQTALRPALLRDLGSLPFEPGALISRSLLVGSLMRPPVCHDHEKAMIVLRRPGPAEISEADAYIYRLVRQAAIGRETAPWTFHVVGPDGIQEVTEHEATPGKP
jgi:hypothetical protein